MSTARAPHLVCSGECRIATHVLQHDCFFPRGVMHLIPKHTPIRRRRVFLVTTPSAVVHQLLPLLVLDWREQIARLWAEPQLGTLRLRLLCLCIHIYLSLGGIFFVCRAVSIENAVAKFGRILSELHRFGRDATRRARRGIRTDVRRGRSRALALRRPVCLKL